MQIYVLILLYSNLYFLAAGAWYVNPVFEIPWVERRCGWAASCSSRCSASSACSSRWARCSTPTTCGAPNPAKYEVLGRFINEGAA